MDSSVVQVVDGAEDATWDWFCAHHGLLMAPRQIPLESLETLVADVLALAAPGTAAPRVRFGLTAPDPVTGETYTVEPGSVLVDGPAFTDEVFVGGPLRFVRLVARILEPGHVHGPSYRDVMVRLVAVAFNPTVSEHLRAAYDRALLSAA